jgi:transmembrane sensor
MISFDDRPLAEVASKASSASFTPLRPGDAAVGALRVTGAYRLGDTEGLARSLAASLGLRVRRLSDGTLLLVRAGSRSQ